MVSKHLGVLKLTGLVHERRRGRETHCSIRPQCAGAAHRLDELTTGRSGTNGLRNSMPC